MRRLFQILLLLALASVLGSAMAVSNRSKSKQLGEIETAYAAAIRWNDFDGAIEFVDPQYRAEHPQTDLERERLKQVQISGYKELRSGAEGEGVVVREVQIRVINVNTQAEREVRVTERWQWDKEHKRWWLANGLPDLWEGE